MPASVSPEANYATRTNIKFPGTSAQATAAETAAKNRLNDTLPTGVTVAVEAGVIKVAT